MLAVAALSTLSFTPPPTNVGTRRDLLASAFSAAAFAPVAAAVFANSAPAPAFAQRSKLVPKSSKEATESYKQFQLSQPKALEFDEKELLSQSWHSSSPERPWKRPGVHSSHSVAAATAMALPVAQG